MRATLRGRRIGGQDGASAVEYGLVVSLIAAVLVIALFALGRIAGGKFGSIDCWSSSGGAQCSQAAGAEAAPVAPDAAPVELVADPAPVVAAPAAPAQLCNQSSNGNSKGKGQGSCK